MDSAAEVDDAVAVAAAAAMDLFSSFSFVCTAGLVTFFSAEGRRG